MSFDMAGWRLCSEVCATSRPRDRSAACGRHRKCSFKVTVSDLTDISPINHSIDRADFLTTLRVGSVPGFDVQARRRSTRDVHPSPPQPRNATHSRAPRHEMEKMRSTLQPHKPPFGLLNARAQAVRLDEVAAAYVRRRLERLRFNLDGAAPWVEASIVQAREEDRLWLLAVASELAATSEHVYDLIKGRAFFGASWAQQASPILVSIDGMLSLYADAAADDYWGRR